MREQPDNTVLHEASEPKQIFDFKPMRLYSMLDVLGAGSMTCDLCGRWQRFSALTPDMARKQLTEYGWRFDGGQDVCPKCAEGTRAA